MWMDEPPKVPKTPCRHTGFTGLQLRARQSPVDALGRPDMPAEPHRAALTLVLKSPVIATAREKTSYRPNPNRSTRAGGGAPLQNHPIHRFTYVQSTAVCSAGSDQPPPRKGYHKPSQNRLFLRRGVKSCTLRSEGSRQPLAAGTSVGSLQRTKRVYMDHALVPAHEECLRVLISPLVCCLSGLDHSGCDPISAYHIAIETR